MIPRLKTQTKTTEMQPKPHLIVWWETWVLEFSSSEEAQAYMDKVIALRAVKDVQPDFLRKTLAISLSILDLPADFVQSDAGIVSFFNAVAKGGVQDIPVDDIAQGHKECVQCKQVIWDDEYELIGARQDPYCSKCAESVKRYAL